MTALRPPRPARLALYALHDACHLARRIARDPARRDSWGRLLGLPNFGALIPGALYRSGAPRRRPDAWHLRELGVRTLICVRRGGPGGSTRRIAEQLGLRLEVFDLGGDQDYDLGSVEAAAAAALDARRAPALIHCDGGRHRAGMVSALVRRRQGWSLRSTVAEYCRYAAPAPFADNLDFIIGRLDWP